MRHDHIDPGSESGKGEERWVGPAAKPAFRDRADAGRRLASELTPVVAGRMVVGALPSGGVAVAVPIAERLGVPLTVVHALELTAPQPPGLAFGAIDEDGHALVDGATASRLHLTPGDIEAARRRGAAEIEQRIARSRLPPLARRLSGATVILVDDGLATGFAMRAALGCVRRHGAGQVIVAAPCASATAAAEFRRQADRFVSLIVDDEFVTVGAYYLDFSPVSDQAVAALLARAGAPPPLPATG